MLWTQEWQSGVGAVKVEVDEDKDVEVAGNQRDEMELFEDNFDAIQWKPGTRPHFLSQKMEVKEPEKKIPFNGIKEMITLSRVLDVCINERRVCF